MRKVCIWEPMLCYRVGLQWMNVRSGFYMLSKRIASGGIFTLRHLNYRRFSTSWKGKGHLIIFFKKSISTVEPWLSTVQPSKMWLIDNLGSESGQTRFYCNFMVTKIWFLRVIEYKISSYILRNLWKFQKQTNLFPPKLGDGKVAF